MTQNNNNNNITNDNNDLINSFENRDAINK